MLLHLPCRYYRVYTDPDVPCVEANFHHVERSLPIPVEQAALVLVDVWSTHYIDSWLQRAGEVTRSQIVPLLEAARRVGMTIVHAPSPQVAKKYGAPPSAPVASRRSPDDWPPAEFRGLYRAGAYAAFGRNSEPRLQEALARYVDDLKIAEPALPREGEPVIRDGAQLHALAAERQILHLLYAGFATNWCVMYRDYGMLAMSQLGYNLILVRDATTGVEFHDSVASLAATDIQIREIETKYAWSTSTEAFVAACARGT
jgi:nicotinamidase-related amidase